jgi:hypothetical protein
VVISTLLDDKRYLTYILYPKQVEKTFIELFIDARSKTVCEVSDGHNLKFSFRRIVDDATIEQWYEILQIVNTI